MFGGYMRPIMPEKVLELSRNIIIQHENFLQQDDPDKRTAALRRMVGYAVQFLHMVPHEKKFTFTETEQVLHNSAMNIAEFDPTDGYLAFCNLAKYAENLLEQPWRKEFHVIKLTSGFYVHDVASQLQNAHEILIAMGYVNVDDRTLRLLPNPNYNNLKAISRDCYIAGQECLILSQIWQQVADQEPDYPLTTGEVFEYRKNHLGDTDAICNKLLYDIRTRIKLAKKQEAERGLQLQHQQSTDLLNQRQHFVPVDRLINYDVDALTADATVDTIDFNNFGPQRGLEPSQEMLRNVNSWRTSKHVYDSEYGREIPRVSSQQRRNSNIIEPPQKTASDQYFYNTNSRRSVPATSSNSLSSQLSSLPCYQQQFQDNYNPSSRNVMITSDDRSSVSKPKSISAIHADADRRSSGGGSSSGSVPNTPLLKSKVKETDLDADSNDSNGNSGDYPYNNSNVNVNIDSNCGSARNRQSTPASLALAQSNHYNNKVYPDKFN